MRGSGPTARARLLCGATALALLCALGATNAYSQNLPSFDAGADEDTQMYLEADTVIYNNDLQTVTAQGQVRIKYGGSRLVAQRVDYNQRTGRIVASGNVEILDKEGTRIFADEIDVTEDFGDGFINALSVETTDDTYFAAESAERRGGRVTVFNQGVYTACEPCEDRPDKAPIWRVKSRKIIWNGEEKVVRFEGARFEFFGLPIAYLPYFEMADPTVQRKSGVLRPTIGYSKYLGASVSVPYFFALSPTYDLTVTGTYYGKQGFLTEAEWRQRFNNGTYTVTIAGISQQDPSSFDPDYVDSTVERRGMIGTRGTFTINPRWSFGWDVLLQSDSRFATTYGIGGYGAYRRTDEIYLTGLNDRNFFDLRFQKFTVLDRYHKGIQFDPRQPWVLPSLDYSKTIDEPVAGGELTFDLNTAIVHRSDRDYASGAPALRGIEGTTGRVTLESEWKRSFVTDGGLLLTPLLNVRGDAIGVDASDSTIAAINHMAGKLGGSRYSYDGSTYGTVASDIRSSYYRGMATAGLEARWPVMFSTTSASHVLEPIAQLFVRPDAPYGDTLGIPNEDAQSLVFDAASLFERDKFSGYDLIEGGTRANLGVRYTGSFGDGWTASGIFGQSYHLAGTNPYASPNLVNAGAFSGLETDVSDFVGYVDLDTPVGLKFFAGGRFDERTFETRRAEIGGSTSIGTTKLSATYAFIQKQPLYGFDIDREEIRLSASNKLSENWRIFGSGTYDLNSNTLATTRIGFGYGDECFTYMLTFARDENTRNHKVDYDVEFRITLRTLGDFGTSTGEVTSELGIE
ncbi:LPS-assembly protein LptD [Aquibium sp. LZ166]|uniref:LPS-assembly protein LptD n=2 Tax=Aquibium pacificus TaxID=3153579 RepID=A0ABV3SNS6_9HYPH